MAKNVLPFPTPDPEEARPTAAQHDRAIFQIGARRFAFQFRTTVTEVNPVDAEILPIGTILVSPPTGGFAGRPDSDTKQLGPRCEERSAQAPTLPNRGRNR